jgi:hypothetical protein
MVLLEESMQCYKNSQGYMKLENIQYYIKVLLLRDLN